MDHFGKYEVIEQIGVGGFGEVFKGFDPDIKRYLAIKTCTSNDKTIRGRFNQEAKIAGNLHHPNITTIYDFGIEGDVPYLARKCLPRSPSTSITSAAATGRSCPLGVRAVTRPLRFDELQPASASTAARHHATLRTVRDAAPSDPLLRLNTLPLHPIYAAMAGPSTPESATERPSNPTL